MKLFIVHSPVFKCSANERTSSQRTYKRLEKWFVYNSAVGN